MKRKEGKTIIGDWLEYEPKDEDDIFPNICNLCNVEKIPRSFFCCGNCWRTRIEISKLEKILKKKTVDN
jgi:hypothetical protein